MNIDNYTAILIILAGLWLAACSREEPQPRISLGAPQSLMTSLVWLAEKKGFFKEQGVDLQLHAYPSGKRALAAMMRGGEELAVTAETPFVIASFKRDDLRLYATMGQSDNENRVLARSDHGIKTPADLRGKTIATQEGSAVHFFLSGFLLYHQLDSTTVNIRFMKAEELPGALAKGDIDAFSMRDPFISQAKKAIGADKLIEFSVPGLYTKTYNIAGARDFVDKHPDVMRKILAALHKSADYAVSHPRKSKEIIARRLQLPRERVDSLWPDMRLAITLNQGLLTTLQEEAQWVVATGQVKESELIDGRIPDFLTRLNPAPLAKAVPHAVGLIGVEPQ
ncbi:MAG: ABC transporter substrate-binding protein [Gammaproteobacteria bacterium]|nr:ABC transporter substrate-binding protein [Gammaproteobacteria bacterium]